MDRFFKTILNPNLKAILIALLAVIAAGCGGPFRSLENAGTRYYQFADTANSTGDSKKIQVENGTKSIDVPYTPSGSTDQFNRIKNEVAATSDKLTAKSIQSVEVSLFDKNNAPTDIRPFQLKMSVTFDPKSAMSPKLLNFTVNLSLSGNTLTGHEESSSTKKMSLTYTTDITCLDLNCSEIDIRLNRHLRDSQGVISPTIATVGMLYRLTHPIVSLKKSNNVAASSDPDLKELATLKDDQPAVRSSVAIVDGHSYSHLTVPEPNTKPEEKKNALDVRTDIIDTQETASEVESLQIGRGQKNIPAELVGSNPETGNMAIDIKNGWRLYVNEVSAQTGPKKPKLPPAAPTPPPTKIDGRQLVPFLLDEKKTPLTVKVTRDFDKHSSNEEVLRIVQVWLGNEPDTNKCKKIVRASRKKLDAILTYGPQVMQLVTPVVQKIDVTPDIAYLLPLESSYVIDPERPTDEVPDVDPPSTALGPWQINNGAAADIRDNYGVNFNVIPIVNGKVNLDDDRTYFYNSTYMAALYLKDLFKQFESDPAIGIMAYHAGKGSARSSVNKTSKYEDFPVTLEEIAEYKMQTNVNCSYLNYSYTYLALRMIGQNLNSYGLKPTPILNKNHLKRLKNPKGPLPPGV